MPLIVEKYGGSSVGTSERIRAVADRVAASHRAGEDLVVVLSAMAGETNRLLELARDIDPEADARETDVLVSTGEQVTIALLTMALHKLDVPARSYTGGQVRILTDNVHGKARILDIDADMVRTDIEQRNVVVIAGFQGVDGEGNITTLGRGGSDTTAVAMAAALQADECRIYTDVDGVYTADPRIVPDARRLEQITVEEMLELSSLGAKVLQTRSVEFAGKYKVPLRVLSSFESGKGTLITYEVNKMEQPLIAGIAYNRDEAKLTIRGVPDQPGVASTIFGQISEAHVNVDMIIQNVAQDGTTDLTFTVNRSEYTHARSILEKISTQLKAREVVGDDQLAKISIVGVGMRSHAGIASTMFEAMATEGINIELISTSEIKISIGVADRYVELAVRALHKAFGLEVETHEEILDSTAID
ncbi:MAG: aspartate kinase [Arenicellales bacterium]|jgi:aspartate kinase|nr:aspartate kinase [Arenicellales bacterium]MDP7452888.1 aspartate kinase [Arenicellales bacterium]MDP7618424.1 aspartate kinase [Arenicellales bacterium]MEC7791755.1 aspartate kinase [Pseudomonadota bacterium]|tara:strand:+ start:930 stop:2183 length:1254 start_codon:yes stop_codon:yes gene_type:complete